MFAILGQLYGFPTDHFDYSGLAGYYADITPEMIYNLNNAYWLKPLYYLTAESKILGYDDGTVRPGQTPIMAELAKAIGEATGFLYYTPSNYGQNWYDGIMATYFTYGVTFNPEAPVTRRGVLYILSRTLQIIENQSQINVHNQFQANGFEYTVGSMRGADGFIPQEELTNSQGFNTNPYGVNSFNNQYRGYYTENGYQGPGGYGSYGTYEQMGVSIYNQYQNPNYVEYYQDYYDQLPQEYYDPQYYQQPNTQYYQDPNAQQYYNYQPYGQRTLQDYGYDPYNQYENIQY